MNMTEISAATAKTAALPVNCLDSVWVTVASMIEIGVISGGEGPPPGTLQRSTSAAGTCSRQSSAVAESGGAMTFVPVRRGRQRARQASGPVLSGPDALAIRRRLRVER